MTRRTSEDIRNTIIDALQAEPLRAPEIETQTKLSSSAVHKHLTALKDEGAVVKNEDRTWSLTGKAPAASGATKTRRKTSKGKAEPQDEESSIDAETPEGALIILAIEGLEIGVEALPASNPARAKLQARHTLLMRELQPDA